MQDRSRRRQLISLGVASVIAGTLLVAVMLRPEQATQSAAERATYTASWQKQFDDVALKQRLAHTEPVTAPAGRPLDVLFVGDSIGKGSAASTEANAFRSIVAAELGKGGPVNPTYIGRAGATTAQVGEMLGAPPRSDLVVVELGTNDYDRTPGPEFANAYRDVISKVRQASPDAALVCLGPWGPADKVASFNKTIAERCNGGRAVALSSAFTSESFRGPAGQPTFLGGPSDNFHPNDAGHARIAQAVLSNVTVIPAAG